MAKREEQAAPAHSIDYRVTEDSARGQFHRGGVVRKEFCRLLMGPIGGGKTVSCMMDFFLLASNMPKLADGFRHSRWAFIRNTGPQLRDTTIKTFSDWYPEPHFGRMRRTDKIFDFRYNDIRAEVLFKALDDPGDVRNLLSLELTGAFLNEAREIDPSIWEGVTGRVGRHPSFSKLKGVLPWRHEPPDQPGRWLKWTRKTSKQPSRITEHYVILSEFGELTADVPLDQSPDWRWVEGPWSGIIADTNPCSTDDFIYKLFEVQAQQDKQVGELYHIYKQPPGLIRVDNRWMTNPNAENIENLPPGYYTKAAVGKDKSWIDVYCLGKYGVLSDGKPVHAGYDDTWHSCEFDFDPGLPVYVGWDFGINGQACVLAQLSRRGQLRVFDEFFAEDMGMYQFARDVVKPGIAKWKGARFEGSYGDPAGNNRAATDEKAAMQILNDMYEGMEVGLPFRTYPTHTNAARPRWDAVDFFLNNTTIKQAQEPVAPRFLIHPRCTLLREGLQGRYEFERVRGTDGRFKEVPKKNRHSHLADGLQYLTLGVISHNDWRQERDKDDDEDVQVRRVARRAGYSGY